MMYFYWNRGSTTHITSCIIHRDMAHTLCGVQPRTKKELEAMAEDRRTGRLCRKCKKVVKTTIAEYQERVDALNENINRLESLLG